MNFNINPDTKEMIKAFSLSGMILVTFFVGLTHLDIIGGVIASIFSALSPFIYGIFFALILMPLRNIVEKKWMAKINLKQKTKRKISVAISVAIMLAVLVAFFALLIPQLVDSFSQFVSNFRGYVENMQNFVNVIAGNNEEVATVLGDVVNNFADKMTTWLTSASGGLNTIVSTISNLVSGFTNFLIGIIIATYILIDSERFKLQTRKLFYAALPTDMADNIVYVSRLMVGMFNNFIFGKGVDSLIIGIICYIACKIMNMPYSVLIAVVVGITNMIPVFGPFIGAIPCLVILVMIDWIKALEFFVFIVILQQVDGNIIGPRILGDAVGLPTVWVMFAIIIGGAFFGIAGMFVGVPVFAVIYTLVHDWTLRKLKEKEIEFPNE